MNIIVAQYYTKNISYGQFSEKLNSTYCEKNGYTYFLETNEELIRTKSDGRSFHWYKPFLILDALNDNPNCDYVLYLDMDAIFINHDRKIEEFISDDYDILMAKDYGPSFSNTGVILFKNNEETKKFLIDWWDSGETLPKYKTSFWWDQSCIELAYEKMSDKSRLRIIDNHDFNSRYFESTKFIFHAFGYGSVPNRTIDNAYYQILNIDRPKYKSLLEMAPLYGSDKHHTHDYFNLIYDKLLSPLKNDVKTFVEVGVYNGDSIVLWRDFFENAKIYGLEKYLENSMLAIGNRDLDRIKLIKMDCSDEVVLNEFSEKLTDVDVILDDASHTMRDQQISLAILFKSLKSGGIFIIEDLHTSLEVNMPEKAVYNWGDPKKTITLDMLKEYQKTGKMKSDYMTEEEMKYLEDNIEVVEIHQTRPDWSITSVIIKK